MASKKRKKCPCRKGSKRVKGRCRSTKTGRPTKVTKCRTGTKRRKARR